MKKLLSVLLVVSTFYAPLFAQNPPLIDSFEVCSQNNINANCIPESKYIYTYNSNRDRINNVRLNWSFQTNEWKQYSRIATDYDANNNKTLEMNYLWSLSDNDWSKRSRNTYSYDAQNNQILLISELWDVSINQWRNLNKTVHAYNAANNVTSEEVYFWDLGTNQWQGMFKYETTYDANQNETLKIGYTWDVPGGNWVNDTRQELTYDANNNVTSDANYNWQNGQWEGVNPKREYDYNSNNLVTIERMYSWASGATPWTLVSRFEHTYNSNDKKILTENYYLNTTSNQLEVRYKTDYLINQYGNTSAATTSIMDNGSWVSYSKIEYTYDLHRNIIEEAAYLWNSPNSIWKKDKREEYRYTPNGKLGMYSLYQGSSDGSQWIGNIKSEYTYHVNNPLLTQISYDWNSATSQWIFKGKRKYTYYFENTVNINKLQQIDDLVNLYPNPVGNTLEINSTDAIDAQFTLINTQGQVLMSKWIQQTERIDVSHLPRGAYFYTITTDKELQIGKIIKQ